MNQSIDNRASFPVRLNRRCLLLRQLLLIGLLLSAAAGCPRQQPDASSTGQGQPPVAKPATNQATAPEPLDSDVKQVLLFYTGDTLSTLKPAEERDVAAQTSQYFGGLSALTGAIGRYESQIVEYNRKRLENIGEDPSSIKADFEHGMLGQHPYLLLDYGGWSRPNDFAGDIYVQLYFRMFHDLHFTAVGCKLYEKLTDERWRQYGALESQPTLLVTASAPRAGTLPTQPIVVREMHGQRWGMVCIPTPAADLSQGLAEAAAATENKVRERLDQAVALGQQEKCDYLVLLLNEGPDELYKELSQDQRFAVVIGGPARLAPPEGFGPIPATGPVMLPALKAGGQEFGVCHLIFAQAGDKPEQCFFTKVRCIDEEKAPLPYRKQVEAAIAEHTKITASKAPTQK